MISEEFVQNAIITARIFYKNICLFIYEHCSHMRTMLKRAIRDETVGNIKPVV
jgi:hypothetical protein